jgi:endonuclease YncB( thermonuclease family)
MGAILQGVRKFGWRNGAPAALALALLAAAARESAAEGACLAGAQDARATSAADARTIVLDDGRMLRLAGVESFALLLPGGDAAEAALQRRLQAIVTVSPLRVRLLAESPDRYGRLPALVSAAGPVPLQEVLAREGLVIAYPGGDALPCFAEILAAEDEARRNRRGFWAGIRLPRAWPDALTPLIGRFAIFEGIVISVGNRSSRTYLNFGGLWKEDVTVEVAARDREKFGGEAGLAALAGKRVRLRGFVEEKAGPMMRLRSPNQLEILAESAGARGKMP